MKRIISNFFAFIISATFIFTALSTSAFANEEMTQEEFLAEVEDYIEVSEMGLIELDLPESLESHFSKEEYETMMAGLDELNMLIESGELEVTENGTIYESNDEELVVQGGNVNKVTWHWWGVRRYASKSKAAKLARDFSAIAIGCGAISTVSGFFGPAGIAVSITTAIVGTGRAGLLANDINYYNGLTDRGVIIDLRWILTYKVSCQ